MGKNTAIAWTSTVELDGTITPGYTANFWWGCVKVSKGCDNCYALTLSDERLGKHLWGPAKTTHREIKSKIWSDIIKWDKNAREWGTMIKVFAQSMSDFFEDHPDVVEPRNRACGIMENLTNTYMQLLTKRPENIPGMVPQHWMKDWPAHIWMGASTEDQDTYDKRVRFLLEVPAKVRWLSIEPLIGPIIPRKIQGLDWFVIGGESGNNHRPMNYEWVRDILEIARIFSVPCFVKQDAGRFSGIYDSLPEDLKVREFPYVVKHDLLSKMHQ